MYQRVQCARCGSHRDRATLRPEHDRCYPCGATAATPVPLNRADLETLIADHRQQLALWELELAQMDDAPVLAPDPWSAR